MSLSTNRIVNFSAGPSAMPLECIEQAREDIVNLAGSGIGVFEHSHRGPEFTAVIEAAEAGIRRNMAIPDGYKVLFLTGGATQQFFQVPMNLLKGGTANYHDTGSWSAKAIKEAKRFGTVNVAASSKEDNYTHIPKSCNCTDGGVYTHFTSNNTIFGTQYRTEPECAAPLVCDASSDIMSRVIDVSKYGIIYAGAQKNLGPAGVTLVIIREDLVNAGTEDIPPHLQYRTHAEAGSLSNTPPCFPIYFVGLVMDWIERQGGVAALEKINEEKAAVLYDFLDSSDYWKTPVAKQDRSRMNVVFRLGDEAQEKQLIAEAKAAGFSGIKGHRSVGGMRASIYNAIPKKDVESFVDFLREFEKKNG